MAAAPVWACAFSEPDYASYVANPSPHAVIFRGTVQSVSEPEISSGTPYSRTLVFADAQWLMGASTDPPKYASKDASLPTVTVIASHDEMDCGSNPFLHTKVGEKWVVFGEITSEGEVVPNADLSHLVEKDELPAALGLLLKLKQAK